MTKPLAILFAFPPKSAARMRALCVKSGVRLRTADPSEYGNCLAYFAGQSSCTSESCPDFELPEPLLVLAGFTESYFGRFLRDMKQSGITGISLKAVLTETNSSWSVMELYRNLCEERNAIASGYECHPSPSGAS